MNPNSPAEERAEMAVGAACATIKEALTNNPGLRTRVFNDVVRVLDVPLDSRVTACQIINTLFGTTLVVTPQISAPLIYDEQP
jgi:hypothetical protein